MSYCSQLTRERILACAKAAFLKNGYANTKLRDVAASAKVTTGPIYSHFGDKEGLFAALVDNVYHEAISFIEVPAEITIKSAKDRINAHSIEDTLRDAHEIVQYMYTYFDELYLLTNCSAGSKWENFTEEAIQCATKQNLNFVKQAYNEKISSYLPTEMDVRLITAGHITSLLSCIKYKLTKKEAESFVHNAVLFHFHGWFGLMGISPHF